MVDGLTPSFIKLHYESTLGPHVMTIPVNLVAGGPPGGTFELFTKDNSQINWITGLTAYVTVLKANFHSTTTFQFAELYSQGGIAVQPVFLDSTVVSVPGTAVGATVAASQAVFSIRSDLGGKAFVYMMDATHGPNLKHKAPTYGAANLLGVVNYLIGSSSIFLCRDNGYPVAVTKVLTKTNDALRKRYRLS